MMKMSRGVLLICLLALVAPGSESAIQELNSINDLVRIYSDNSVPLHSLTLLHWFANRVNLDNNNVLLLNFNPRSDFGSHYYGNREGLVPTAPNGYEYYTIGNVNHANVRSRDLRFPEYFLKSRVNDGSNRDRIIFRVENSRYTRISQVYLTQHYTGRNYGSAYDPDHTYRISTNLIRQLRLFSFFNRDLQSLQALRDLFDNNIEDNRLNDIRNIWNNESPLGLLYEIVTRPRGRQVGVCRPHGRFTRDLAKEITSGVVLDANISSEWKNCERQHIHVQVIAGDEGKAKIIWKNVTREELKDGVALALFRHHTDKGKSITFKPIRDSQGSYETKVPLNEGLQVRLHKTKQNVLFTDSYFIWTTLTEEICRGEEFQSPSVSVTGYAQLQLFVKDGKACIRLFFGKGCTQWKLDFSNSWVGLYASAEKHTSDHLTKQWQWVTKLEQGQDFSEYNTFEYCSTTTVTPGLQARFMIKDYEEKARTPVWH